MSSAFKHYGFWLGSFYVYDEIVLLQFFSAHWKLIHTDHVTHLINYVWQRASHFVVISPRGQSCALMLCVLGGSPLSLACVSHPLLQPRAWNSHLSIHSKVYRSPRLRLIGPGACISCITWEVISNYLLRALKFHTSLILGFFKRF